MKNNLTLFIYIMPLYFFSLIANAQPSWYEWPEKFLKSLPSEAFEDTLAPNSLGVSLSGKKITLKDFNSKITFVSFWATWCPLCMEELPHLPVLQNYYKKEDLQIVMVAVHTKQDELVDYLKNNTITLPVVHDSDNKTAEAYGVFAIPAGFLIDSEGRILKKWVMGFDTEEKRKEIDDLLRTI